MWECMMSNIEKLVQGRSGNMKAMKKDEVCVKGGWVDRSELLHFLWPVKQYRAGAVLFSLTCKFFQSHKLFSD